MVDYAKMFWMRSQHHKRWERRVLNRKPLLGCQECGTIGGWVEPVLDFGEGPWEECGWCEGTGYVDNWQRAAWLGYCSGWSRLAV